jgi:hypothetical protein
MESSILDRVIRRKRDDFSSDLARWVLTLDFPAADHRRIARLSKKAQAGALSTAEEAQLDAYLRINDFLMIVQSKARAALRQPRRRIA